jgi:hypothetical protein
VVEANRVQNKLIELRKMSGTFPSIKE